MVGVGRQRHVHPEVDVGRAADREAGQARGVQGERLLRRRTPSAVREHLERGPDGGSFVVRQDTHDTRGARAPAVDVVLAGPPDGLRQLGTNDHPNARHRLVVRTAMRTIALEARDKGGVLRRREGRVQVAMAIHPGLADLLLAPTVGLREDRDDPGLRSSAEVCGQMHARSERHRASADRERHLRGELRHRDVIARLRGVVPGRARERCVIGHGAANVDGVGRRVRAVAVRHDVPEGLVRSRRVVSRQGDRLPRAGRQVVERERPRQGDRIADRRRRRRCVERESGSGRSERTGRSRELQRDDQSARERNRPDRKAERHPTTLGTPRSYRQPLVLDDLRTQRAPVHVAEGDHDEPEIVRRQAVREGDRVVTGLAGVERRGAVGFAVDVPLVLGHDVDLGRAHRVLAAVLHVQGRRAPLLPIEGRLHPEVLVGPTPPARSRRRWCRSAVRWPMSRRPAASPRSCRSCRPRTRRERAARRARAGFGGAWMRHDTRASRRRPGREPKRHSTIGDRVERLELRRHAPRDGERDGLSDPGRRLGGRRRAGARRPLCTIFVSPRPAPPKPLPEILRGAGQQLPPDHAVIPGLAGQDASGGIAGRDGRRDPGPARPGPRRGTGARDQLHAARRTGRRRAHRPDRRADA